MITFLFWNVHRKPLDGLVRSLALEHTVDVIILAEYPSGPGPLLNSLNSSGAAEYHFPLSNCSRIQIFTRFSREFLKPLSESARVSIRRLSLPAHEEILLATAHLPSKLYSAEDSQQIECMEFADTIRTLEQVAGHERTVVIGDLNMNPFETAMIGTRGLHAAMTRQIAARGSRKVQSREYPFFYNPMWGHFGDREGEAPGTYYYGGTEHVVFFWNMFDQVLLRPELASTFRHTDLRVLTSTGGTPLITKDGLPDARTASDHLPVLFKLNLKGGA